MDRPERTASIEDYAAALEDLLRETTLRLARLEAVLRRYEAERDAAT